MDIRYDRSNQGPNNVDIQVDTGSGFTSVFTDGVVNTAGENNDAIDLSFLTNITNTITFRLFAFNATAATGTFDIEERIVSDKGIIINGIVSALPCPGGTVTWNGTWSGTPDLNTEVIISANYNTSAGNFSACSLTIDAGVTLTVSDGTYVEVENDVTVNGTLSVQSSGNFVQRNDTGTFTVNPGGLARVNKQTASKAFWYYYTYWSSPVVGWSIAQAFPDAPGDRRFWFNAANFVDTNGDDIDDNGDDWQPAFGGDVMQPGVGYAATESRFHFPGATGTASFEGPFNTGNIDVPIFNNPANVSPAKSWNFIGNPYPSAIDFIAFQSANRFVVDGAAYFWSQASPPDVANAGNQNINFDLNDYAVFAVESGGSAGGGPDTPTQYIPSTQGFFIAGLTNRTATFTNDMRMADATSNSQFFKNSNSKKSLSNANRLWVNLTSDNGVFNQILVAYVDGATNNYDGLAYDAPKLLTGNYASALYSIIESESGKFAVQGKATSSLSENEVIKLGFATNIDVPTQYTLSLAQLEGDFLSNNPVYLKDNLLNTIHDLSASNYTFTSEVGEFNQRFEIVFIQASLSNNDEVLNAKELKIIELEDDQVQFSIYNGLSIKSVAIFDLLGRQLYTFNGTRSSETYTLNNLSSTIFIAKVALSNGSVITKKVIKK